MQSLTASAAHVKSTCPCEPLFPVRVRSIFVGGASREDIIDNAAALSGVDAATNAEKAYQCTVFFSGERRLGFRLTEFASGEVNDLPHDLSGCVCPDQTYKSERPGGCCHLAALRQPRPTVAHE
jgi:hypothetical protein